MAIGFLVLYTAYVNLGYIRFMQMEPYNVYLYDPKSLFPSGQPALQCRQIQQGHNQAVHALHFGNDHLDFFMGRFITKPMSMLNASAKRMAELDFSAPCDLASTDEFGELSVSLNTMSDNLRQALPSNL